MNLPRAQISLKIVLLLSLLFVPVHLLGLTRHGFWIDEFHTYSASSMELPDLVENRLVAGHLPTYFILIKVWCGLVGFSEGSMRFISVIFAALAFLTFSLLVRKFLPDGRTAWLAIALFFFQPFLLWASHEARMYSALLFAALLSSYLLLTFLQKGKKIILLAYGLSLMFGLSLHLLFFFQLVVHLVFVIWRRRDRLPFFLLAATLALAALSPLLLLTLNKTTNYTPGIKLQAPSVSSAVKNLGALTSTSFRSFLPFGDKAYRPFVILGIVFFVIFLLRTVRRKRSLSAANPSEDSPAAREAFFLDYCFFWIAVPVALMLVSEFFNNERLRPVRYYTPLLGAVTVVAAVGLARLKDNLTGRALKWGYCLFFCMGLFVQFYWPGRGMREAIEFVKEHYRKGDSVFHAHMGQSSFALYGCDHFKQLKIDEQEPDEAKLLEAIRNFADGDKRVWLLFYKIKESHLPSLFKNHPETFKTFEEFHFRDSDAKGALYLPEQSASDPRVEAEE